MSSCITYIEVPDNCSPFTLLQTWIEHYKSQTNTQTVIFNLATSSANGDVSNRYIELQELSEYSLTFGTKLNSLKTRQITENPNVSANFLFTYGNEQSKSLLNQQVRLKGSVERLSYNESEDMFKSQELQVNPHSILIQEEGVKMPLDEWKKQHDCLLEQVNNREVELKKPESLVSYKINPNLFDFYQVAVEKIGHRILFKKDENGEWELYNFIA